MVAPLDGLVLELDTGGGKKFQDDEPTAGSGQPDCEGGYPVQLTKPTLTVELLPRDVGLLPRNNDSSKMHLLEHFTKQLDQYEG